MTTQKNFYELRKATSKSSMGRELHKCYSNTPGCCSRDKNSMTITGHEHQTSSHKATALFSDLFTTRA